MSDIGRLLKALDQRFTLSNQEETEELAKLNEKGIIDILNNLDKDSVTDNAFLEAKLGGAGDNYRKIFSSLFKISRSGVPSGSFVVLDNEKVSSLLLRSDFPEEVKGNILTVKEPLLRVYCQLVNEVNGREPKQKDKPTNSISSGSIGGLSNKGSSRDI